MKRSIREKIENYLLGRMSAEEKQAFEEQMSRNTELKKQVQQQKWIQEAVLDKEALAFREKMNKWEAKVSGKKKVISLRRVVGIAAAVLILIVAGYWLLWPQQYSAEELFASYYSAPEPQSILPASYYATRQGRTGDDTLDMTLWREARQLLEQQQWADALEKMEEVPVSEVAFPSEYYYELGILYLENKQYEQAVEALQQVDNGQAFGKSWYLALTYLALGDIENTRTQLKSLTDQPNSWQEEARALRRQLPRR